GEFVKAQHVHYANGRQRGAEQIGSLREASADEQSAVAAAADGQLRRRRIFIGDQPFGGGDEIVKHVLLLRLCPGQVPLLTVFGPASQIGRRVNSAHPHPDQIRNRKRRRQRNAEAAIAVKQRRILAVELQALLVRDEHRHTRSIFAVVKDLF